MYILPPRLKSKIFASPFAREGCWCVAISTCLCYNTSNESEGLL